MSRLILLAMCLTAMGIPAGARDSKSAKESLAFSCLGRPFLSVAALTPERDDFPAVQLTVTDALGRTAGQDSSAHQIPDSSYGKVVQIPEHPERSKARAVEICNAKEGVYELKINELQDQPYLIIASGSGDVDRDESAILNHLGRKGRVRRYKFKFGIEDRQMILKFLDEQGHEQFLVETPEW